MSPAADTAGEYVYPLSKSEALFKTLSSTLAYRSVIATFLCLLYVALTVVNGDLQNTGNVMRGDQERVWLQNGNAGRSTPQEDADAHQELPDEQR